MPGPTDLVCRLRWRAAGVSIVAAAGLAAALLPAALPARGDAPQRVTLIGDSVPDALNWGPANDILAQGIDLDLETSPCRRTEEASCPGPDGTRPTTLIQLVQSLGSSIGQTVVVMIGYNDYEDQYQKDIGDALTALDQAGVQHVLWLTLREARVPYISMNADIASWTASHPELTVLDWNMYSRSHDDWFQGDGLHLTPDGAIGLATFLHSELVDLGVAAPPPAPTTATTATTATSAATTVAAAPPVRILSARLPAATEGKPYTSRLHASGGRPPYRWRAVTRLPHGFGLARDGLVTGIPRAAPGTFGVVFGVTDASGRRVTRRVVLRVSR